jgi:hypothetical protein
VTRFTTAGQHASSSGIADAARPVDPHCRASDLVLCRPSQIVVAASSGAKISGPKNSMFTSTRQTMREIPRSQFGRISAHVMPASGSTPDFAPGLPDAVWDFTDLSGLGSK